MYHAAMRLSRNSILLCLFIAMMAARPVRGELVGQASYDVLDPRLPGIDRELLWRLQVASGSYLSVDAGFEVAGNAGPLDRQTFEYLNKKTRYPLNYSSGDFRFWGGMKIKEDWLGISEGDSGISNLQTGITFSGKAKIKNKIELYEDITLFRSDSTSYLDSASTTGEFLKNPLFSQQLPGRGSIASEANLLEVQVDRALIKGNLFGVDIQTGRDRIQIKGGYRNGLLFSGLTRPVDMFYRLDYSVWRVHLTALSGQLTDAGRRYISAKRVEFEAAHYLRFGATEAAAFSYDPTAYINPLMPFYIIHRHRPNNDDNLIASFDFSLTPRRNLNIYGEILDDDIIIFKGGASKYGVLVGLYGSQLFSERIDLRMEYAQARKWTYTHVSHINAWDYRDQPFGFWLGPDADELYGRLSYLLKPGSYISANFDYVRKGEGSLDLPFEDEGGDKTPAFPSGLVEKSAGGWLDLRHEIQKLEIGARLGYRHIENRHHEPGKLGSYFAHCVLAYWL